MIGTGGVIRRIVYIDAPLAAVWSYLVTPSLMKKWMIDPGMEMDIITGWKEGSTLIIKGDLHGILFENKGIVLKHEPGRLLQYSHLSSLSHLPGNLEDYSNIEFELTPMTNTTKLNLSITNFPTETIFKHLDFYWANTIEILKKIVEKDHQVASQL